MLYFETEMGYSNVWCTNVRLAWECENPCSDKISNNHNALHTAFFYTHVLISEKWYHVCFEIDCENVKYVMWKLNIIKEHPNKSTKYNIKQINKDIISLFSQFKSPNWKINLRFCCSISILHISFIIIKSPYDCKIKLHIIIVIWNYYFISWKSIVWLTLILCGIKRPRSCLI